MHARKKERFSVPLLSFVLWEIVLCDKTPGRTLTSLKQERERERRNYNCMSGKHSADLTLRPTDDIQAESGHAKITPKKSLTQLRLSHDNNLQPAVLATFLSALALYYFLPLFLMQANAAEKGERTTETNGLAITPIWPLFIFANC